VAEDIPDLKQAYKGNFYEYNEWEEALNIFLECTFRGWTNYNASHIYIIIFYALRQSLKCFNKYFKIVCVHYDYPKLCQN
jgi:hypothetical protein